MATYIVLFLLCVLFATIHCFINVYPPIKQEAVLDDPGEPLYLTPFIRAGKINEARNLSEVTHDDMRGTKSFSGYLTVNEKYNSNLFFWFFPSITNYENAPVVLWLQGGPGATSLFGLFTENGPFIPKNKHIKKRKYTWSQYHSVIYIDNPVGTGYSFTDNEAGYANNEIDVGTELYEALRQFFKLFPELQKNDFFVTGESYAGKYVPAVSYFIHKNNPEAKVQINLKGLAIGNGFSDPINQVKYGDYLYQLGLIDRNTREVFHSYEQKGVDFIKKQEWKKASVLFDSLLDGDLENGSIFKNVTGFENYYNYLKNNDTSKISVYMGKFIQSSSVRKSIHVGKNTFYGLADAVRNHLIEDMFQSVTPWIATLLDHYRVLVYNGQLDIIVAYPLTLNYLQKLKFSASDEYKTAPRHIWKVDGDLAGFVKVAGNLTEVLVRDAGHMVPSDQPKWALDLITRFTHNKPFY